MVGTVGANQSQTRTGYIPPSNNIPSDGKFHTMPVKEKTVKATTSYDEIYEQSLKQQAEEQARLQRQLEAKQKEAQRKATQRTRIKRAPRPISTGKVILSARERKPITGVTQKDIEKANLKLQQLAEQQQEELETKAESEYQEAIEAKPVYKETEGYSKYVEDINKWAETHSKPLGRGEERFEKTQQLFEDTGQELESINKAQFEKAIDTKPIKFGKTDEQYAKKLNKWIETNKDVLGRNYEESQDIIEGTYKLTGERKKEYNQLQTQLENFKTRKMASSSWAKKIYNKAPKYSFVTLAGTGSIRVPYYEGEYKELVKTKDGYSIVTYDSKLERITDRGNPITKTTKISEEKIDIDPLVADVLLSEQKFQPKVSFSQEIAKDQKQKKLEDISKYGMSDSAMKQQYEKDSKSGEATGTYKEYQTTKAKEHKEKTTIKKQVEWYNPYTGKGGTGTGVFYEGEPTKKIPELTMKQMGEAVFSGEFTKSGDKIYKRIKDVVPGYGAVLTEEGIKTGTPAQLARDTIMRDLLTTDDKQAGIEKLREFDYGLKAERAKAKSEARIIASTGYTSDQIKGMVSETLSKGFDPSIMASAAYGAKGFHDLGTYFETSKKVVLPKDKKVETWEEWKKNKDKPVSVINTVVAATAPFLQKEVPKKEIFSDELKQIDMAAEFKYSVLSESIERKLKTKYDNRLDMLNKEYGGAIPSSALNEVNADYKREFDELYKTGRTDIDKTYEEEYTKKYSDIAEDKLANIKELEKDFMEIAKGAKDKEYRKATKEYTLKQAELTAAKYDYLNFIDPNKTGLAATEREKFLEPFKGVTIGDVADLSQGGLSQLWKSDESVWRKTSGTVGLWLGKATVGVSGAIGAVWGGAATALESTSGKIGDTSGEKPGIFVESLAGYGKLIEKTGVKGAEDYTRNIGSMIEVKPSELKRMNIATANFFRGGEEYLKYKPRQFGEAAAKGMMFTGIIALAGAAVATASASKFVGVRAAAKVAPKIGKLLGVGLGGLYTGSVVLQAQSIQAGELRQKFYGEKFLGEMTAFTVGAGIGGATLAAGSKMNIYNPKLTMTHKLMGRPRFGVKKTDTGLYIGKIYEKGTKLKITKTKELLSSDLYTITNGKKVKISLPKAQTIKSQKIFAIKRKGLIGDYNYLKNLKYISPKEAKILSKLPSTDVVARLLKTTNIDVSTTGNIYLNQGRKGMEYNLRNLIKSDKKLYYGGERIKPLKFSIKEGKQKVNIYDYFGKKIGTRFVKETPTIKFTFKKTNTGEINRIVSTESYALLQKQIKPNLFRTKTVTTTPSNKYELMGSKELLPFKEYKIGVKKTDTGIYIGKYFNKIKYKVQNILSLKTTPKIKPSVSKSKIKVEDIQKIEYKSMYSDIKSKKLKFKKDIMDYKKFPEHVSDEYLGYKHFNLKQKKSLQQIFEYKTEGELLKSEFNIGITQSNILKSSSMQGQTRQVGTGVYKPQTFSITDKSGKLKLAEFKKGLYVESWQQKPIIDKIQSPSVLKAYSDSELVLSSFHKPGEFPLLFSKRTPELSSLKTTLYKSPESILSSKINIKGEYKLSIVRGDVEFLPKTTPSFFTKIKYNLQKLIPTKILANKMGQSNLIPQFSLKNKLISENVARVKPVSAPKPISSPKMGLGFVKPVSTVKPYVGGVGFNINPMSMVLGASLNLFNKDMTLKPIAEVANKYSNKLHFINSNKTISPELMMEQNLIKFNVNEGMYEGVTNLERTAVKSSVKTDITEKTQLEQLLKTSLVTTTASSISKIPSIFITPPKPPPIRPPPTTPVTPGGWMVGLYGQGGHAKKRRKSKGYAIRTFGVLDLLGDSNKPQKALSIL